MSSGITWLVESSDQLFLVCVCFVGFDFSTEAWCRVHDIGVWGCCDALGEYRDMAASCPASPLGLKANRIYFMNNFLADDADLRIFDVELIGDAGDYSGPPT